MKIVQSLWTKPLSDYIYRRSAAKPFLAGWSHKKYFYISWALSCLQMRKFYPNVELVTDELGKELLIDKLGLPYSNVRVVLNKLDHYPTDVWALGKLYAYQIQKEPFIHVDSDIFIFNEFEPTLFTRELVAQNIETDFLITNIVDEVRARIRYTPDILGPLLDQEYASCSNAGIMGGTRHDFFAKLYQEASVFLERNHDCFDNMVNVELVNHLCEQFMFYRIAKKEEIPVTYLFPQARENPVDVAFFHAKEKNNGYVHAVGGYKRSRIVLIPMEQMLKDEYPEYHDRLIRLLSKYEL